MQVESEAERRPSFVEMGAWEADPCPPLIDYFREHQEKIQSRPLMWGHKACAVRKLRLS